MGDFGQGLVGGFILGAVFGGVVGYIGGVRAFAAYLKRKGLKVTHDGPAR